MNRRGFIASLVSAATLDPDLLLWVPGAKTVSIPDLVASRGMSYFLLEKDGMTTFQMYSIDGAPVPEQAFYVEHRRSGRHVGIMCHAIPDSQCGWHNGFKLPDAFAKLPTKPLYRGTGANAWA